MGIKASASGVAERNHCASHGELIIRFALWASDLREVPTWERIRQHFVVSRATAFRWRRDWCDAMGIDPAPQRPPRKLTKAEVMRAKKARAGMSRAADMGSACLSCEFYRAPVPGTGWWGRCLKHELPARPRDTCTQHHRENTKPGGNRHPQTTVQGP